MEPTTTLAVVGLILGVVGVVGSVVAISQQDHEQKILDLRKRLFGLEMEMRRIDDGRIELAFRLSTLEGRVAKLEELASDLKEMDDRLWRIEAGEN